MNKTSSEKHSISKVAIVAKHIHPEAGELCKQAISWLQEKKYKVAVERETARELGGSSFENLEILEREECTRKCDAVIVLGGDGTLISVCRHASKKTPLILGVNPGTLGFLTEITRDELSEALNSLHSGEYEVESRSLFHCQVKRNKKLIAEYHVLNDVVITKQALARIFGLKLSVDTIPAASIRGDGIIIATPGGSTAYSMAAGGSIVHPQVAAILVTPICPHSLTSRPLVLPGTSTISLEVAEDIQSDNIFLTIDGQSGMALESNDKISVKTSPYVVDFFKSQTRSYYDILAAKLKWSAK